MALADLNPPVPGPCGTWIDRAAVTACCAGLTDADAPSVDTAIIYATAILYRASGRQFPGICSRKIRPCVGDNSGCSMGRWTFPDNTFAGSPGGFWSLLTGGPGSFPGLPFIVDGQWFNSAGSCGGTCRLPTVTLPAPVGGVTEVLIDGVALDPSAFNNGVVRDYRELPRTDGLNWPCSQDMSLPPTEPGTWQITYSYGSGPGPDGQLACARFACEIAKLLCNAADCMLPQRYKRIDREGVRIELVDPLKFLDEKGRVGVELVDMWIRSVNPNGLERRSTIGRLDVMPPNWAGQ